MIRTRGLVKRYGGVTAVAGIDLDVEAGDSHGFLGWFGRRLLRRMRRAARPALGDLQYLGSLPRWVLVTGRVTPGPEGVLASPAFDTPCVWYRTEVRIKSNSGDTVPTGPPSANSPPAARRSASATAPAPSRST